MLLIVYVVWYDTINLNSICIWTELFDRVINRIQKNVKQNVIWMHLVLRARLRCQCKLDEAIATAPRWIAFTWSIAINILYYYSSKDRLKYFWLHFQIPIKYCSLFSRLIYKQRDCYKYKYRQIFTGLLYKYCAIHLSWNCIVEWKVSLHVC